MALKEKDGIISGKIDYETLTEDGRKIIIGNIFSLSDKGAYFDWGLESCGFGQFSFSYSKEKEKWYFGNECMGPESSYEIIKAFENGIKKSGNEKAIYNLNKIISLISYQSSSLAKSILLIWKNAELEGGEVKNITEARSEYIEDIKKNESENTTSFIEFLEKENLKMFSIEKDSYEYQNKRGHFLSYELSILLDMKFNKEGLLNIKKVIDIEKNEVNWYITEGANEKLLKYVFKVLDEDVGHYGRIWKIFRKETGLKGSINKLVKEIFSNYKKQELRFKLR